MKTNDDLSHDLKIHPGETLSEALQDRHMSQKELSELTGMTEKLIDDVVNGKSNISPDFAERLEDAFGVDRSFWINLQTNYDREQ